jgi:hypothetical protein
MKTFDEFIDAQLDKEERLDEILGNMKDRAIAAVGSKIGRGNRAKGRLARAAADKKLDSEWKAWMGEQGIRKTEEAMVADYLEFLRDRVGFALDEEAMNRLTYGPNGNEEAPDAEELITVFAKLRAALEQNENVDEALLVRIKELADVDTNVPTISKNLLSIAREHSSQQKKLMPVADLVGRRMSAEFYNGLRNRVAGILIKKQKSEGGNEPGSTSAGDGEMKGLEQGLKPVPDSDDLKRRWSSDVFKEMEKHGLDAANAKAIASRIIEVIDDQPALTKEIEKLDRRFSAVECVNLTRCCLLFFTIKAFIDYLEPLVDKAQDIPNWETMLLTKLSEMRSGTVEENGQKFYDASDVNHMLFSKAKINKEAPAARMLALVLYCLGYALG